MPATELASHDRRTCEATTDPRATIDARSIPAPTGRQRARTGREPPLVKVRPVRGRVAADRAGNPPMNTGRLQAGIADAPPPMNTTPAGIPTAGPTGTVWTPLAPPARPVVANQPRCLVTSETPPGESGRSVLADFAVAGSTGITVRYLLTNNATCICIRQKLEVPGPAACTHRPAAGRFPRG